MRKQRCIGRDHNDDGAAPQLWRFLRSIATRGLCCRARPHARGDPGASLRKSGTCSEVSDLASYWGTQHLQIAAIIALHQHAQRVLLASHGHKARGGADATFESIADHTSATTNRAFLTRPARCRVECRPGMLGLDVL